MPRRRRRRARRLREVRDGQDQVGRAREGREASFKLLKAESEERVAAILLKYDTDGDAGLVRNELKVLMQDVLSSGDGGIPELVTDQVMTGCNA